jgi:hypothetical protein
MRDLSRNHVLFFGIFFVALFVALFVGVVQVHKRNALRTSASYAPATQQIATTD